MTATTTDAAPQPSVAAPTPGRSAAAARVAAYRAEAVDHASPRRAPRERWRLILSLGIIGAIIGVTLGFVFPAGYRSEVSVLITRLAATDGNIESALTDEARFVNAVAVRDRVRSGIVEAPDAVEVAIDVDRQVLVITAEGDSADEALRLARNWSNAFINERRGVLIDRLNADTDLLNAELDDLTTRIGVARLAADDDEVMQLEARRDNAATELAAASNDLSALEAGLGAEVIESASMPSGRSGISMLPASVLGAVIGALIGLAIALSGARRRRRDLEARAWLDAETEGVPTPSEMATSLDRDDSLRATDEAQRSVAAPDPRPVAAPEPLPAMPHEVGTPLVKEPLVEPAVRPVETANAESDPSATPDTVPVLAAPTVAPAASQQPANSKRAEASAAAEPPQPAAPPSAQPPVTVLPRPVPDWRRDRTRSLGRSLAPAPIGYTKSPVRVVDLRTDSEPIAPITDEWADDLALLSD